jgi:hypothetical protein
MTETRRPSDRTARLLRENSEQLEETEAALHRSAEASPHPESARRLHRLGDAVTAEAHRIEHRADLLDTAGGHREEDGSTPVLDADERR